MSQYFIDCEFNGFKGELLSIALQPKKSDDPKDSFYAIIFDAFFTEEDMVWHRLNSIKTTDALKSYIDNIDANQSGNVSDGKKPLNNWVLQNVVPKLLDCPQFTIVTSTQLCFALADYFRRREEFHPYFISDWPDDIKYISEALLTGPGTMIDVHTVKTRVMRVDAYPTEVVGAVQHNAWWDALALKERLKNVKL